jgi:hypothetical protein
MIDDDDDDLENLIKILMNGCYIRGRFDGMVMTILCIVIGLIVGYLARYFFIFQ